MSFLLLTNFFNDNIFYYLLVKDIIISSVNCVYIYDLIYNKLDKPHTIHHILTIVLQGAHYIVVANIKNIYYYTTSCGIF